MKKEEEAEQKRHEEELLQKKKTFSNKMNKITMENSSPSKIKNKAKDNLKQLKTQRIKDNTKKKTDDAKVLKEVVKVAEEVRLKQLTPSV